MELRMILRLCQGIMPLDGYSRDGLRDSEIKKCNRMKHNYKQKVNTI